MLLELQAANAAFAIIKTTIQNGKDIASAGKAISDFVGAKEDLQKKAQKKGGGSDLEEFLALEELRSREEELKTYMIYAGRPGLWNDWQKFQAKARVARREAEEAAALKRKKIIETTIITVFFILGLAVMGAFVALLLHHSNRL